ncbi:mitochondrial 54S ribosomal protein YmL10/YmL18 [Sugiyamaella lignohabitans]|uniref:Mitochondrial 54S ribosomal protein YmL10/YmL18 n=1 Tax=Sugiyamaella lignohabitans TaxID=796027 RepID=A0A167D010_9ASCO|nr:mitochondrial 54S ribosomal protein YmL10/YmL18 [Sugiyamaella lignohabitans]ANB12310.1 mitochondrial 54S ribosomal protein YmL10/YmL18 [Sugiyamaella lignohabitans]
MFFRNRVVSLPLPSVQLASGVSRPAGLSPAQMIFQQCRYASGLGSLAPAPGATRQQNRVGRGPGSGRGKTSGRGQKGQKARGKVKSWFEGGQTPITRLFPKVGFRSQVPKPEYINLDVLQRLIDLGRLNPAEPITMKELYRSRYFGNIKHGIKILGGDAHRFTAKINISSTSATPSAIARIEALGGTFQAEYYTPFGMKVLTRPEAILRKYGRIPLRARPIDRKSIEFYRDPERRGYLVGAPGAPTIKAAFVAQAKTFKSPLLPNIERLKLNDPSTAAARAFQDSQPKQ